MKKIAALIVFSCCIHLCTQAQNGKYAFSKIDTALLKNANAVLREEQIRFEVKSTKETIETNHYAITILNEKGDHWANFFEQYDKHTEIDDIEGVLYDFNGKELKKIKKKDTQDLSGTSDGTLMSDNRFKAHNFYYKVYPYTIEYTVETSNKASLFFPKWVPQGDENFSVENSTISIVAPQDYLVRFKMFNYNGEPVASSEKDQKVLTWTAKNLRAVVRESDAPMWHELTTMVIFGPSQFQMDEYLGNMVTWQDFGKFVYALKQGRDQLTEPVKQQVHTIADGITDPKEKVARLYEYMQRNTRYISIQLGIGGWQPFDAKDVSTKGYGDCKALANFMYSLLKEAGIKSNYTLVRAGRNAQYITEDFPAQQFNHVIVSVPMQKDTMWLECTSQTLPAGYLSYFTCNRPALLIDENGGKLIRTPAYGIKENVEERKISGVLDEDGSLNLHSISNYRGMEQDHIHSMIHELSKDKQKEELHEKFDFATYDIVNFDYQEEKSSLPTIRETLDILVSNYATITGKRLFIIPNVMTRMNSRIAADTARKYDMLVYFAHKDVDSVEIELPQGYSAEALPQPVTASSSFGSFNSSVKLTGNKIYYYRSVEYYSGRFPASSYNDRVKFYETIYKADRTKIVLVKSQ